MLFRFIYSMEVSLLKTSRKLIENQLKNVSSALFPYPVPTPRPAIYCIFLFIGGGFWLEMKVFPNIWSGSSCPRIFHPLLHSLAMVFLLLIWSDFFFFQEYSHPLLHSLVMVSVAFDFTFSICTSSSTIQIHKRTTLVY